MAPTPKSSAPAKGVNPAPNYTTSMNSIQLLINSKAASLFAGSLGEQQSNGKPATTPHQLTASQARARAEEAELEQAARLETNMGIGLFTPTAASSAKAAKDRDDRLLKGRLLGKGRKRKAEESFRSRREVEESSDEEEGRSGVGRSKQQGPRRLVRRKVDLGEEGLASDVGIASSVGDELGGADDAPVQGEKVDWAEMLGDDGAEEPARKVEAARDENGAVKEGSKDEDSKSKKKRKKKKNKKSKSSTNDE